MKVLITAAAMLALLSGAAADATAIQHRDAKSHQPNAVQEATAQGEVTLQNLAAYYRTYLIFNQCAARLRGYFAELAASVKGKIDAKHFSDDVTDGVWKKERDNFYNAIAPAFDRADDGQVSQGCEAVARLYEPNPPATQVQKP